MHAWSEYISQGVEHQATDPRKYWRWIKSILRPRDHVSLSPPILDPAGSLLLDPSQIRRAWTQHYRLLATDPDDGHSRDASFPWPVSTTLGTSFPLAVSELPDLAEPDSFLHPTLEQLNDDILWPDVLDTLRRMKSGKAPGPDGIPLEWLQLSSDDQTTPSSVFGRAFFLVIQRMWQEQHIPDCWRSATVVSIPKRGDRHNPNNYRGISLMSVPLKTLCALLAYRLSDALDSTQRLSVCQAGFRSREEAVAQAGSLYEILTRRRASGLTTYVAFLDLAKAFDTVPHSALFVKLYAFGIRGRALSFLQSLYAQSLIRVQWGADDSFPLGRGVRQGCPLSPLLFDVFIDDLLSSCTHGGVSVPGAPDTVPGLLFADDGVLLAESADSLQSALDDAGRWATTWGMSFGISKCGTMVVSPESSHDPRTWTLQGCPVPHVHQYLYLGTLLTSDLDLSVMAQHRARCANSALAGMSRFLRCPRLPLRTRTLAIKAILLPSALYGAEIWGMHQERCVPHQKVANDAFRMLIGASPRFRSICRFSLQREVSLAPIHALASARRLRLLQKLPILATWGALLRDSPAPKVSHSWILQGIRWLKSHGTRSRLATAWQDLDPPFLRDSLWDTLDSHDRTRSFDTYRSLRFGESSAELLRSGLWIRYPQGARALLRMRTGSFVTAQMLARFHYLPSEYLTTCPFCSLSEPETLAHLFIRCTAWSRIRATYLRCLSDAFRQSLSWSPDDSNDLNLTRLLLGGHPTPTAPTTPVAAYPRSTLTLFQTASFLEAAIPQRAALLRPLSTNSIVLRQDLRLHRYDAPCTGDGPEIS
jgi:hypothetical protein